MANPAHEHIAAPACFAAGTLVHTKTGLKPIEEVRVGDSVLSKHESGEGSREYKRVTKTYSYEDRNVILIYIGGQQTDGTKRWTKLITTPEHLIWTQEKGWKPAKNLKLSFPILNVELMATDNPKVAGQVRLFATDDSEVAWVPMSSAPNDLGRIGSLLHVKSQRILREDTYLQFESVKKTKRVSPEHLFKTTVHNIEIEDLHTCYVCEAVVLVHSAKIYTKPGPGEG